MKTDDQQREAGASETRSPPLQSTPETAPGVRANRDQYTVDGNVEGVGIAIGAGASVRIYGDVHYYPIKLRAPLRHIFDPLIEDRTKLFAGRADAFDTIADFIRDPTGGYLVITAPAGFGKTALMAALVSRTPDAFAYHFFSPLSGQDSLLEVRFLRNVVEQMAQWHGHTKELPGENEIDALRALYHHFIVQPLERTQVLVLDGLDEITTWKFDQYLSRRLPPNLHIIVTVRDVGQDWRSDYQFPPEQTRHLPLDGLSRNDVAQVLHTAGGQAVAFADDPDLLDEIMRIAAHEVNPNLGADPF